MKRHAITKLKHLSESELLTLEQTLKRYAETSTRDILLIEVALRTGGRASEVLGLKKSDLAVSDDGVHYLALSGLKGSDDRDIPISSELYLRLKRHALQTEGDKLFDLSVRRFEQIWFIYRPCLKKLHSLRHTFAIELYKKHKDVRLVQVALGHRSINSTMVYATYQYKLTELKRLIA